MKKNLLKIFLITALTLCLPLTGIGITRLTCPCSGHEEYNQAANTSQKTTALQGCCEKDSKSQSPKPCQCGDNFCDFTFETKSTNLIPLLTDSVALVDSTDLRAKQSLFLDSSIEPPPLYPFTLNQEFLYLQIQNLRC